MIEPYAPRQQYVSGVRVAIDLYKIAQNLYNGQCDE